MIIDISIRGAQGSGKTSLARLIACLFTQANWLMGRDSVTVTIDGQWESHEPGRAFLGILTERLDRFDRAREAAGIQVLRITTSNEEGE